MTTSAGNVGKSSVASLNSFSTRRHILEKSFMSVAGVGRRLLKGQTLLSTGRFTWEQGLMFAVTAGKSSTAYMLVLHKRTHTGEEP